MGGFGIVGNQKSPRLLCLFWVGRLADVRREQRARRPRGRQKSPLRGPLDCRWGEDTPHAPRAFADPRASSYESPGQPAAGRATFQRGRRPDTGAATFTLKPAAGPGAAKVSSLGRGYAPRSSSFRRPPCLVPRRIRGAPRERYSPTPTRYLKGGPPRASGGNEPVGGTRRSPGCFACTTRRTITHENATAKSPGDEHVSDRRAACAGRTDLTTP